MLSGFCHSNHLLGSNAFTLNAVVSFTFSDIGIQSPTFESWHSGNPPSAIS